jgi:hypothetical protein
MNITDDARDDSPRFINGVSMHSDRDGKPIGLWTWSDLMGDPDYVLVALTEFAGYWVVTFWEGTCGLPFWPPLIFRTVVYCPWWAEAEFFGWYRPTMDLQDRYATEYQARKGHDEIVGALLKGLTLETFGGPRRQKMIGTCGTECPE